MTRLYESDGTTIGPNWQGTDGSGHVRITGIAPAVTIPISGTVTANQGGSWTVGVSGTVTVAGTVTANQGGSWTVGVSGTVAVTQSGTWNISAITGPITPGFGATNLGKREDDPHSNNDVGVAVWGVRNDGATPRAADGDYIPFQMDSLGGLQTSVIGFIPGTSEGAGGKQLDAASTSIPTGTLFLGIRNDTRGSLVDTDLDYTAPQMNASGDMRVELGPTGSSAGQIQGTAAIGAAGVGNPVWTAFRQFPLNGLATPQTINFGGVEYQLVLAPDTGLNFPNYDTHDDAQVGNTTATMTGGIAYTDTTAQAAVSADGDACRIMTDRNGRPRVKPEVIQGTWTEVITNQRFNDGSGGGTAAGTRFNGTSYDMQTGDVAEVQITIESNGVSSHYIQIIYEWSNDGGTTWGDTDHGWEAAHFYEDTEVSTEINPIVEVPRRGQLLRMTCLATSTTVTNYFDVSISVRWRNNP